MKTLYEQVYESLKKEIISSKYKVGDRVPSEKDLADTYQVSRITTKKALEKLMNEGYVYRQQGRGTFVSEFKDGMKREVVTPEIPLEQKKPLFGLIVTSFDDSFGNGLVSYLEEASTDHSFIILKQSKGKTEIEEKHIKELLAFGVDGLIVSPAQSEHYSSEILKMVVNKFPLVLIDRAFKGVAATSVSTENEDAAEKGMNHLFQLGHEHVGVLMPINYETTTIEDRLNGIVHAFANKQTKVNRELWFSNIQSTLAIPKATKREDIEAIKEHIKQQPQMTALFALEYHIAVMAKIAVEELGYKIPRDISIICFDSPPDCMRKFTHLKQNEKKIGELAITRLLDMCKGEFEFKQDKIPATLVKGNTTTFCSEKKVTKG